MTCANIEDQGVVLKRKTRRKMDPTKLVEVKNRGEKQSSNKQGKRRSYALMSYKELPDYMKDNEFILNYYRVNWSLKEAFFSIFRWHNETLNVWT